jgi:hypothetical protein
MTPGVAKARGLPSLEDGGGSIVEVRLRADGVEPVDDDGTGVTVLRDGPTITRLTPTPTRDALGARFVYTVEDEARAPAVPAYTIGADARGTAYPVYAGAVCRGTKAARVGALNPYPPT